MSNLVKPYEIAVYKDVLGTDGFEEKRLGIIGSDTMIGLNRALEPNLVRNVNGQNKFSFKMYKKYTDPVTGEQVTNPFIDWLVSERKIKLEYDGKWYDFIIKDINENSSNYLYTYQLEDALVQELSKNGFGVTLDEKLMNNVGTSKQLGQFVMEETDWTVDGEVPVQTIEEPLVYLKLKRNINAIHLLDQQKDANGDYSAGVTESNETVDEGSTILAFYSSCKNKPHRFQFIYSSKGYNRTEDDGEYTYNIDRKDDRIINEKDCQYYIEFDNPEEDYTNPEDLSNSDEDKLIKQFNLYLPTDYFTVETAFPVTTNKTNDEDTTVSTWYRGARYGFSQQAQYVPLLERYCQKFEKRVEIPLEYENTWTTFVSGSEPGNITWQNDILSKASTYAGVGTTFDLADNEYLYYEGTIKITNGELDSLSWNGSPFVNEVYIQNLGNGEQWFSDEDKVEFLPSLPVGTNLHIKAKHIKRPGTGTRRVRLIPNINDNTLISLEFSNFRMYRCGDYYGYTDSKFVSPTLIKNYITNSVFEGDGGWTATTSPTYSNQTSVTVEPVYCRINNNKHTTIVDDFLAGTYQEPAEGQENPYSSKMKTTFFNNKGFVLNSCIKDNRTEIEEMPSGEEWILDYKIVNEAGDDVSSNFDITLGEYNYNTSLGGYEEKSAKDIDFTYESLANVMDGTTVKYHREKITVSEINNYSISTFKENSRIYLKISPKSALGIPDTTNYENDDLTKPLSTNFYIEKLSLYRKVLNDQNEIIEPDFESDESQSAEEYINSGTIEHKYKYFNEWYVNSDNPNVYTDKEALPTITRNTLSYEEFKPVYNVGAEKVRSISQKESNYFNILQSIAETFEQWLVIEVNRDSSGAICPELNADGSIKNYGKKIKFKNYRGDNNYACFRYGVNLKDIQRTYSSKNIVTKLMVKPNNNENAKDGFCTIQRAGSNPTGENYIYDFQYYQNKGIMDIDEYLNKAYNLTDAQGPDGELWDERVTTNESYNLNGYFHRLKKINDTLLPLNEDLIGVRADLLERRAEKEVVDNTIEAAETSIEQVRKDFKQLIGVYPDEIQQDDIKGISIKQIIPKYGENWYTYGATPVTETVGENQIYTGVSVNIVAKPSDKRLPFTVNFDPLDGDEIIESDNQKNQYEFIKKQQWSGAYIATEEGFQNDKKYRLTYSFSITGDSSFTEIENIGCHNAMFGNDFTITVKKNQDSVEQINTNDSSIYCFKTPLSSSEDRYNVVIEGTVKDQDANTPYFWIQPNRGLNAGPVSIRLFNINLELINGNPAESTQDRVATVYVKAKLNIGDGEETTADNFIEKTYQVEINLPAGATTASCVQTVATVDMEDPDVRTYIEEYTLLRQKLNRASEEKTSIDSVIAQKEAELQEKNNRIDTILNYKKVLNQLFYQRYSRFIQEGTWISEEYVDDEKYYIDAQSVLYNSCYPQVTYAINVLELSQLPGYEMFKFKLGDKTWAIDEDFFGNDGKEEVIITETSEMLEDPSKNTIKVQNFKNQFQDLFQKITATVQQTQYNSGSYEKGSALMNATAEERGQFVIDSINGAAEYLTPGYGHTVTIGNDGITIIDDKTNTNKLRLVGGAILFGETDKVTNEDTWTTGITNKGISADLINAGQINTNVIQIRNGRDSLFNWDSKGISAYSSYENQIGIDKNKFVRFDKYGIYGIDHAEGVNDNWKANTEAEVVNKATFALTWEGLKVSNSRNIELHIGDGAKTNSRNNNLLDIRAKGSNNSIFAIKEDGSLVWSDSSSPTRALYARTKLDKPIDGYDWAKAPGINSDAEIDVWHRTISPDDKYASYTYNGGVQWSDPIVIRGDDGETGKGIGEVIEYYALSDDSENAPEEWTPNKILQPTQELPYLWNYEVTKYDDNDNTIAYQSDPIVIAYYTEDGDDGRGIVSIQNYYLINSGSTPGKPIITEDYSAVPEDGPRSGCWYTTAPKTTIIDEYLWNCEIITYSKEPTTVTTDPAVIGTHGSSPYAIALNEDFISVPSTNDGTVNSFPSTPITPVAFYGDSPQKFEKESTTGLGLFIDPVGLNGEWDNEKKTFTVTSFKDGYDRGTVKFILKKDNEDKAYAIFEAVKQKSGTDGTPGEYVYAVSNYNEIKTGSFPDKIQISILKRTSGVADPSYVSGTVYYKVSLDGKSFSSKFSQPADGVLSISNSHYSSATSTIRIDIFSDSDCKKIIDKVTISVLKDGENGEGVYILYHDIKSDGFLPDPPNAKYSEYGYYGDLPGNNPKTGWYKDSQDSSVYMCQQIAAVGKDAADGWGAVTRISGVLSTKTDLLDLLENKDNAGEDGIYDDGNGNIGINATAIKTGAINVGGTKAKDYKDARLYADVKRNNVYIAGWTVSEQYLQNGTFWLYGENSSAVETSLLNSANTSKILIASGEKHFATKEVTEETETLIPETYYEDGVATNNVCFLLRKYTLETALNPSSSISYITTDTTANVNFVIIGKTMQTEEGLQIVLTQKYGANLNNWINLRVRFNISYKPLTDITDFMVLQDGSLYANAFRVGRGNQNNNLWISNSPRSFLLNYIGTQSWLFTAGRTFGITGNGTLYATNAKISSLEVCNSLSFTASDDFDQASIFNMCKTPYEVVTCGKTSNLKTPLDEYTIAGIDTSKTNVDVITTYLLDDYWCIVEVEKGWSMTLTTPTTYPCITNQVTIKHEKMATAADDILTLKGFRIGSNNQAKFSLAKDGSLTSKEGGIGGWYYSIDEGFRTTIANQVSYKIQPTGVSKVTYSESSSTTDVPISWEAIFGAPSVASTNAANIADLQSKVSTINGWSIGGKKIKYGKYKMPTESQKLIRHQISTGLTTIDWAITTPDISGDENKCEMQGGIVNIDNGKITVSYQGQNATDQIYAVWWMAIGT